MKKEFKNFKVHFSRFLLLIIFILLIGHRTVAQCTHNTTCACELGSYDIVNSCSTGCADYQTHLTNLANPAYGLANAASVTMSATGFPGTVTVGVAHIKLYDTSAGCGIVAGPPADGYTVEEFNAAGFNITFATAGANATVSTPGAIALPIGYVVNFIVNVSDASGIVTSRNYFFKITNTAYIVGDPHITTVDGIHYDFQAAGEFTILREGNGDDFELQIRQSAVATSGPGTDSYSGLTTCVSLNTAVAVRVGTHRISYQPNINGQPDSSGMQLRVDGELTELGNNGIDLGSGGRIVKASAGAGIQIESPDGTSVVATSNWWSHYSVWYLNVNVYRTAATKGIMGVMAVSKTTPGIAANVRTKSWLPALPDGSSLGPRPQSLHDRFVQLYQTFADAWRVTDQTSLFVYAPGTSTATFTNKNWPSEHGQSCSIPGQTPLPPIGQTEAEQLASAIVDPNLKANAIFDVMITGEPTFAKAYLVTQQVHDGTTTTSVNASEDKTKSGEAVTFTATVTRKFSTGTGQLNGTVEFTADGNNLGQANLDANGRATITTTSLEVGQHQISAKFIPDASGTFFSSSSSEVTHTVLEDTSIWKKWWFWVLVILILIILFFILRKKKP